MSDDKAEVTCRNCSNMMTARMARLTPFCIPCLERSMDELTTQDIAAACRDFVENGDKCKPLPLEPKS